MLLSGVSQDEGDGSLRGGEREESGLTAPPRAENDVLGCDDRTGGYPAIPGSWRLSFVDSLIASLPM